MAVFETDYLVIGAGAAGLAFADTLLQESDAHITLVDRHALPGGHWNEAYPFVTLHQPSAFYGVNSRPLGSGRKDDRGPNAGLYELAGGAEICSYFQQLVQHQLLPSGRVRYLPLTQFNGLHDGQATLVSLLTGAPSTVQVRRKWVDASFFSPDVPATTAPAFAAAPGVRLLTPTQLAQLGLGSAPADPAPAGYCVLGAGKTAMDALLWLLAQGVPPAQLHWVVPRDAWLVNRLTTQPGEEFFMQSIGGMALQMRALAEAQSVDDLFLRLEAGGQMLRVDPGQTPRMFHFATLSEGEVQALRAVTQVLRGGRVLAIEPDALVLQQGRVAMAPGTVYVNCTASAVRPKANRPIFEPGRITPQLVRAPLVTFSAAVCAYVEAHYGSDDEKNALCAPVPFPHTLAGFLSTTLVGQANQLRWNQDKTLRDWMRQTRLDGFGRLTSQVSRDDAPKMAVLAELRQQMGPAMANAQRLLAASTGAARG
jgi:hypothetical protein